MDKDNTQALLSENISNFNSYLGEFADLCDIIYEYFLNANGEPQILKKLDSGFRFIIREAKNLENLSDEIYTELHKLKIINY